MTDEHPNAALARESFGAMERGDTQWFDDHLADDVVWHVGGNSKAAGEYRGRDNVLQLLTPAASSGGSSIDVHDILANDEHTVILGTAHLQAPDGDRVDYRFVNVFHIQDGKVTEAWGMSENDAETDAFFDKFAPS
jgi:ketosteroid isomerase-like protein